MIVTKNQLLAFVRNAENAWTRVVYSFDERTTPITINEINWYRLPLRFSTRSKIFQYYRRYWSRVYANRLTCSVGFRNIRGRLYSPNADPPILQDTVTGIRIIRQTSTRITVEANFDYPEPIPARYVIAHNPATGALKIISRRSRIPDFRYEPCSRGSSR
ncbi:DL-endopeptidase inhibitor IseA family protein [Paenibacillus mucilaginosus]|uniref:DL-endopeptidase inhibitor IseA family protein n=1 Tax=Paenibacillus mucilaginosus TaxID=61624 RepID=UPI003D1DF133